MKPVSMAPPVLSKHTLPKSATREPDDPLERVRYHKEWSSGPPRSFDRRGPLSSPVTEFRFMQADERPGAPATPQRVIEMLQGFWIARTLTAAVELKIFSHVAEGRDTLDALRQAT